MSRPTTSKATPSATSSPESASGRMLFVQPDGQIHDQHGQPVALASLSPRQASALGLMTSDTCGQPSLGSQSTLALQSSLENKLRVKLSMLGSTLYTLTWKRWTTPLGPSRSRLRASVPRTSATDSTGWPTPTTRDWKDGGNPEVNVALNGLLGRVVWLSGWPTPHANSTTGAGTEGRSGGLNIQTAATLAGWSTPTASLADKGVRSAEGALVEVLRNKGPDLGAQAAMTGWPTTTSSDALRHPSQNFTTKNITLNHAAVFAGWPTPTAQSPNSLRGKGQDPMKRKDQGHAVNLTDAVHYLDLTNAVRLTVFGELLTGSGAGMPSGGQLSPAHSRWLMGLPAEWCACAPMETRSTRKPRKPSSKRSSKPSETDWDDLIGLEPELDDLI